MPRSSIKDQKRYQALRDEGASQEKAARIANAGAASSPRKVAAKGGRSGPYTDWKKDDLLRRAREIGIRGRSSMNKQQLISALREH
jgi:Rho termination factor, N-terminal domain